MSFSFLKLESISNIVLDSEFSNLSNKSVYKYAYTYTCMDKIPQILISFNFPLKLPMSENAFGSVAGSIHAEKLIPVFFSDSLLFFPSLFPYSITKPDVLKISISAQPICSRIHCDQPRQPEEFVGSQMYLGTICGCV